MSSPTTLETDTAGEIPAAQYDYSALYKSPAGIKIHRDWYEQNLKRLAVPYERKIVQTRFGPTHMLTLGPVDAPPLVLIHSLSSSIIEWEYQLEFLGQAQTYRVYALDIPGVAPTSAATRLKVTNSDYAVWLLDVLHELGIKRADFAALGSASGVICKLAGLVPNRLNSVVLINPIGIVPFQLFSKPLILLETIAALLYPHRSLVRHLILQYSGIGSQRSQALLEAEVDHFIMFRKYLKPAQSFIHITDAELSKLTAPTLLITGQFNKQFKLNDLLNRARRLIPRLTTDIVPGSGCDPELEQPAHVNQSLANFLRQNAYNSNPYAR